MVRNSIRISLVLNNKEQYDKWKKQLTEEGYGNFSQMVRTKVERSIEKKKEPIEKSLEPIKNALDALFRQVDAISDKVDIINNRLPDIGKEINSEVYKAAKVIKHEFSNGELTLPEIIGKLNFSPEVSKKALVLLQDIGLLVTQRRSSKT